MNVYCRRCCKRRKTLLGKTTNFFVNSKHYGYAEISLPNPVCMKCVKEMKDFWESKYPKFNTDDRNNKGE